MMNSYKELRWNDGYLRSTSVPKTYTNPRVAAPYHGIWNEPRLIFTFTFIHDRRPTSNPLPTPSSSH